MTDLTRSTRTPHKSSVGKLPGRFRVTFAAIAALLVLMCAAATLMGPVKVTPAQLWDCFFPTAQNQATETIMTIVWQIRLPRVVLAVVVGTALAASGTAFQSLLRNDLADPYILGVSSGASICVAAASLAGTASRWSGASSSLAAFVGGSAALLVVATIARVNGRTDTRSLVLAGVIVNSFLAAVELGGLRISGYSFDRILNWLMGSLASGTWADVGLTGAITMICLGVLVCLAPSMNVYAIGEESARQLGLDASRFQTILMLTATVLAAAAVAASGVIGFVGLISPHLARKLIHSADHRRALPISCLCGSLLLLASDTLARVSLGGDLLPVGVVTAFLGAPFFCYQLRRR